MPVRALQFFDHAIGVGPGRTMPNAVRNASARSRSGDCNRPYTNSLTLTAAMVVLPKGLMLGADVGCRRLRDNHLFLELIVRKDGTR
jgi:hypothetical protein